MSRPGKFGKSSRTKQLRQFRRRKQQQTHSVLTWDQVEDFLLGRYHLVQGIKLPTIVDATVQRFFSEWLVTALAAGPEQIQWDVATITETTLKRIGNQVPWQFYAVLSGQHDHWEKFLWREVPVMPIAPRRQVTDSLSPTDFAQVLAQQLAVNLLTVSAVPVTTSQRDQLATSLVAADHLQWSAVSALFTPLGFKVSTSADQETSQWLNDLQVLTVSDFH
ncbi:hypothetical protein [Levilactobacillus huananensis]|uniref:hypothetical protein n=1 Tax=Levilactobacillus huananensis TaxID=2486019 RepID=UPI000F7A1BBB|nr:hypothetical protein [Levilactobacillus huananensis]